MWAVCCRSLSHDPRSRRRHRHSRHHRPTGAHRPAPDLAPRSTYLAPAKYFGALSATGAGVNSRYLEVFLSLPPAPGVVETAKGCFVIYTAGRRERLGPYATRDEAEDVSRYKRREMGVKRGKLISDELAADLHPTRNGESMVWPSTGSSEPLWWRCRVDGCGYEWIRTAKARVAGSGCLACARRQNGLRQSHSHSEVEARLLGLGFELLSQYQDSRTPVIVRHLRCGSIHPTVTNRVFSERGGCRCSKTGYRTDIPGTLYVLEDAGRGAVKIGISNYPEQRFATLRWNGWSIDRSVVYGFRRATLALRIESDIKDSWRSRGWQFALPRGNDGYTETVSTQDATFEETEQLVLDTTRLLTRYYQGS